MAKEKVKFKRSKFGGNVYKAVANQVRADWQADQLALKHQEGALSDQKYINGLTNLLAQYQKGTGTSIDIQAERAGVAQQIAESYVEERGVERAEFLDKAMIDWTRAQTEFAQGMISDAEYRDALDLYEQAVTDKAPVAGPKKLTQSVLSGKFFDQYKSGRIRNIMREKQIKNIWREVTGEGPGRERRKRMAGGEAGLGFLRQKAEIEQREATRNLAAEQRALEELKSELGRLPTPQEIRNRAYGT